MKKDKILKTILFISLIIFFEPQMFKDVLIDIDKLYKILKIISFFIIGCIYFKENIVNRKRLSKILIAMVSFQIFGLISTIYNKGSITRFIGPAITTLCMIMIAELLIEHKIYESVLKKVNIYFRICFVFNIISIFLVDKLNILNGRNVYFLGIDNRWIFTYLPWITFECIIAKNENKNMKIPMLVFVLTEITLIYKYSTGAMIFSVLWILIFIPKIKIAKHALLDYILTIIANILIVIVKIQEKFHYLLVDIMHKSDTLSGRTFLWDKVLKTITEKKILGFGMQTLEFDQQYFYTSTNLKFDFLAVGHAHNTYMTVLYRRGIVGLINYVFIWIITIIRIIKNKDHKYANILFLSMLIVLLLSILDTIDAAGVYFILGSAFNIRKIGEDESEE